MFGSGLSHTFLQRQRVRFRRYCRAGWAVFRSLSLEVQIGTIASYIADRQLRKSQRPEIRWVDKVAATLGDDAADDEEQQPVSLLELLLSAVCPQQRAVVFSLLFLFSFSARAQQPIADTCRQLPEVSVHATSPLRVVNNRIDTALVNAAAAVALDDLLELLPAADVRTRGIDGMQADISLRGGNYNQAMLLLNSINMTDPHTGHYTLDLPVGPDAVEQIGLLSDAPLAHFGLSSFCGILDIRTRIADTAASPLTIGVSAGSYGSAAATLTARQHRRAWHLLQSLSYHRSDGYSHNTDYRLGNLFLQARRDDTGYGQWDLQAGLQMKDYGANAFYSLAYPDQYESVRTGFASALYSRAYGWGALQLALYDRVHTDRFELFRQDRTDPPAWYSGHNYHLSHVAGAHAKATLLLPVGQLSLGAELRDEGIVSSQLGSPLRDSIRIVYERSEAWFRYGKRRCNLNTFAQYDYLDDRWQLSAGGSVNFNSMFHTGWGADLRAARQLSQHLSVNASVGRYLRFPTFTDLYYSSAVQVGNSDLRPEEALCFEAGAAWQKGLWCAEAVALHRRGGSIIDWTRQPDETLWHCANLTDVNVTGVELSLQMKPCGAVRFVRMDYACYHAQKQSGDLVSKYALDYLRHNISLSMAHAVGPLTVGYRAALQQRNGSYTDAQGNLVEYTPVALLDAHVTYPIGHFQLGLTLNNLLNRRYYDFGGIEQPGFHFRLTASYALPH